MHARATMLMLIRSRLKCLKIITIIAPTRRQTEKEGGGKSRRKIFATKKDENNFSRRKDGAEMQPTNRELLLYEAHNHRVEYKFAEWIGATFTTTIAD